jgi:hypothetical protein
MADSTHQPRTQETEQEAMQHMWRIMGYENTPDFLRDTTHVERPIAPYTESIVPSVTLTEPTPPSSQEPSPTSKRTTAQDMASAASEEDASSTVNYHPGEMIRSYPSPPTDTSSYSEFSPKPLITSPCRFVPRPAKDYEAMLHAMAIGNFDCPALGAAGTTYQRSLEAWSVPTTPPPPMLRRKRGRAHEIPSTPGTPKPQPKKRKSAETPHDTDGHDTDGKEVESALKEPMGKNKAVKIESPTERSLRQQPRLYARSASI